MTPLPLHERNAAAEAPSPPSPDGPPVRPRRGRVTRYVIPLLLVLVPCAIAYRATRSYRLEHVFARTTLPEAQAASARTDPPGLVVADFDAKWCGPCQAMKHDTWSDSSVQDWLARNAVAVEIDTDRDMKLSVKYHAYAIPLVVVFRGEREVARAEGYQSADELLRFLRGAADAR